MNLDIVAVWSAIQSLQRAVEQLSEEVESEFSVCLLNWDTELEGRLQSAVDQCVRDGSSEEAISKAIDAGMPPVLAHLRHRVL